MTISPSRTNFFALSAPSVSTSSGKYLVRGFPDFDSRSIFAPSRKARQRKPSHLGSYCQFDPEGSSEADIASIGAYVLARGKVTRIFPDWCGLWVRAVASTDRPAF